MTDRHETLVKLQERHTQGGAEDLPRYAFPKTAIAYAAVHGGPAGIAPFAALWLRAQGAPLSSLGVLLALPLIGRIVAARPLTAWAARFANPWRPVALLCGFAAIAAVLALAGPLAPKPWGAWTCILAWWAMSFSVGACTPLMDAAILNMRCQGGELDLAQSKGIGAMGYILANLAVGVLFTRLGTVAVGLWAAATAVFAAALILILMGRKGQRRARTVEPFPIASAGGVRWPRGCLALALAAAALIEASHGFNSIAMITWKARGYGADLSGLLWATGIVADIAFLGFMGSRRRRIAPERLLIVGGAAALLRWAGFAVSPPIVWLFALQALHALSFTATYLASVELVQKFVPREQALSGQTANWGLSSGLCAGLGALLAGPLYATLGVGGYWAMSGLAALGLAVAAILYWRSARASYGYANAVVVPIDEVGPREAFPGAVPILDVRHMDDCRVQQTQGRFVFFRRSLFKSGEHRTWGWARRFE